MLPLGCAGKHDRSQAPAPTHTHTHTQKYFGRRWPHNEAAADMFPNIFAAIAQGPGQAMRSAGVASIEQDPGGAPGHRAGFAAEGLRCFAQKVGLDDDDEEETANRGGLSASALSAPRGPPAQCPNDNPNRDHPLPPHRKLPGAGALERLSVTGNRRVPFGDALYNSAKSKIDLLHCGLRPASLRWSQSGGG